MNVGESDDGRSDAAGIAVAQHERSLPDAARRARAWRRLARSTWFQRAWGQAFANLEALLVRSRLHRSGSPSAGAKSEVKARAWLMWVEAVDLDLETDTGPDIGAEQEHEQDRFSEDGGRGAVIFRGDARGAAEDVMSASTVAFVEAEAEAEAEARYQARAPPAGVPSSPQRRQRQTSPAPVTVEATR